MSNRTDLELEQFLPYRLSVLSNNISQAIARDYEERFRLTVTEWRVIAVLAQFEGISANEVAKRTAMDKVAVSRAVARLTETGRIKRSLADRDKRYSILKLTASGKKIYREIAPLALAHERSLLTYLSNEERHWLNRILDKLWQSEIGACAEPSFGIHKRGSDIDTRHA